VIAVDPTSPFTGGAVLGDRLRMQSHALDDRVFVRSMATRGHLGGLARATGDAALVLDAGGYDVVVIETVGVGQDEVEIAGVADVCVVTLVPGAGDDVQALKAGLMEIADLFVVNKADREGASRLAATVEATLALREYAAGEWRPRIVETVATQGKGIDTLMQAIEAHRREASAGGAGRTRVRARSEARLRDELARRLVGHVEQHVLDREALAALVDRIAAREIDPYSAVDAVMARTFGRG
jgi:LAO/AO transport system kinase